jgi:hypothetical protein
MYQPAENGTENKSHPVLISLSSNYYKRSIPIYCSKSLSCKFREVNTQLQKLAAV